MKNKNIAVILFNLCDPDNISSVKKFLFNLFYDRSIINLPNPYRWTLAKIIYSTREKTAIEIYDKIGGKSPILTTTLKQADKLELKLNKENDNNYKVFVSMRYWHPFALNVIRELKEFEPDEVVLLPLYSLHSTTTGESTLKEFKKLYNGSTKEVCCYFSDEYFIKAHVEEINKVIVNLSNDNFKILFSAHGLPEKIIKKGDPYQWQVEQTVKLVTDQLDKNINYVICYESRVGPLVWIGPSTEEELINAAKEEKSVVIVPIAFVSDHSETLVELDIEYKELFKSLSSKDFIRVPALNENKNFTSCIEKEVKSVLNSKYFKANSSKEFCKCYRR